MALENTHSNVLADLKEAQHADHDGREKAREADHFVNKKDGQWEPDILKSWSNKPRYTIDLTSGIIADVHGEMASMDFTSKVKPAGGPSTSRRRGGGSETIPGGHPRRSRKGSIAPVAQA